MAQRKIFFLHNPKGGGTSLRTVFKELIGNGTVAPVFSNAPNAHRSELDLLRYRGFDFYAGHYGYDAYRRLRSHHLLFTNFRDPVTRVFSIYRYWRNNITLDQLTEAHPSDKQIVELAHQLPFSEFVRADNRDLKLYISNFHFRQLHSSGWEQRPLGRRAEWQVKRRVAKMPWFYIAETPQASTLLLQQILPELGSIRIPRENQSYASAEEIDGADVEYLTRLNLLDYDLYAYALKTQERRLRQYSLDCEGGSD